MWMVIHSLLFFYTTTMKNSTHNNLPVSNELISNPSLAQLLKQQLSVEDLVDLGLIRNPIYDNHQVVKEIKEELAHYQDDATERGIEYAGSLSAQEEVSSNELARALDPSDLLSIKEQDTPQLKRSNFRYISKQYNPNDHYTRYVLANGQERIVTDDELATNPRYAYTRQLSDCYEEADREQYNKLKAEMFEHKEDCEIHQCFIRIWWKEYGNIINFPNSYLRGYDMAYNRWIWFEQKEKFIKQHTERLRKIILSSIWITSKQIPNIIDTKIKIINTNNKCITIL